MSDIEEGSQGKLWDAENPPWELSDDSGEDNNSGGGEGNSGSGSAGSSAVSIGGSDHHHENRMGLELLLLNPTPLKQPAVVPSVSDENREPKKIVMVVAPPSAASVLDGHEKPPAEPMVADLGSTSGTGGATKITRVRKEAGDQCNKGKGRRSGGRDQMHIFTERERRKRMRTMFSSLHAMLPPRLLSSKADKSTIVEEAVKYIKDLEQVYKALLEEKKAKLLNQKTQTVQGLTAMAQQSLVQLESLSKQAVSSTPPAPADNYQLQKQPSSASSTMVAAMNNNAHNNYDNNNNNNNNNDEPLGRPLSSSVQTFVSQNVIVGIYGDDAHINVCSTKKRGVLFTIAFTLDKYNVDLVTSSIHSDERRSICMVQARVSKTTAEQLRRGLSAADIFKMVAEELSIRLSSSC